MAGGTSASYFLIFLFFLFSLNIIIFLFAPYLRINPRAKDGTERQVKAEQKEFIYIFVIIICGKVQMAFNFLNMRRSSPPYKANRRFAVGWQTVVEQNTSEGVRTLVRARTVFCRTQKCRTGIFALIVCYLQCGRIPFLLFCLLNL